MYFQTEVIARLQALKSLLDIGDTESVTVIALKLNSQADDPSIAVILEHLASHRYADASRLILDLLNESTRIVTWNDPEIALLKSELETISSELAETQAEHAEVTHLIARFQALHHQVLGEKIAALLRLRLELLKLRLRTNPSVKCDVEEAQHDYDDFQRESAEQARTDERSQWQLSDDEEIEIKRLFRQASKKCHPDVVLPEFLESASELFRDLNDAYEVGDLETVRKLATLVSSRSFRATNQSPGPSNQQKEEIRSRILKIRTTLTKIRFELQTIKDSSTYKVLSETPNWSKFFCQQAEQIDIDIQKLTEILNLSTHESL
jgi:hypothetical protein